MSARRARATSSIPFDAATGIHSFFRVADIAPTKGVDSKALIAIYNQQYSIIRARLGVVAADRANYGWGQTKTGIATKVNGNYDIVESSFADINSPTHKWVPGGDNDAAFAVTVLAPMGVC